MTAVLLAFAIQRASADTAANFTIVNHATSQPLSLYSYEGSVILLDFWAYWCGPCQDAASDIEPNITEYYRNAGGNQYGVRVTVLSISIDLSDPSSEDTYIQTYGLEIVGDDSTGAAFNPYDQGYIPQFVVINGATNSANTKQWDILYNSYGYATNDTVPAIKMAIDSVKGPATTVLPTGSLQVTLSPATAVAAGAQWQVDGGAWRNSGASVSGLLVTNHLVNFSAISGWVTPASKTVTVSANQTSGVSVAYRPALPLSITGVQVSGPNLVLQGINGVAGATYHVLMSPDLGMPLSQWSTVATVNLIVDGNFNVTVNNTLASNIPQRYYAIKSQ